MVKCKYCKREMKTAHGCDKYMFKYEDGAVYAPLKITPEETYGTKRCGDCASEIGGYHHIGCDQEKDPRTGNQALMSDAIGRVKNIKPVMKPMPKRKGIMDYF